MPVNIIFSISENMFRNLKSAWEVLTRQFFFGGCSKLLSFIVTQNSQNYKYNLLGFFLNQREAIFSLLLSCDICGKEILISTAFL